MRSFFKRIERNSMERLQQQLNFLLEMDKEKSIKRQTRCTDHHMENDAEHAWHIALACLILSEYANEKIDVFKTVAMLLIHDVVEIDADQNIVYLGTKDKLYKQELKLSGFNLIDTTKGTSFEAYAKIRNNIPLQKVNVELKDEECILHFETPVSAITNGQAAVLYDIDDKHLIGGAWIG